VQVILGRLEHAEKERDDLYEVARLENERKVARLENERKVARRDDALNKLATAVKEGESKELRVIYQKAYDDELALTRGGPSAGSERKAPNRVREPTQTNEIFYQRPYQSDNIVALYRAWICRLMRLWSAGKAYYNSPYTALCQSSGYGKSKLLVELGKHFHVFYICLRRPDSSGVPSRTLEVAELLCSGYNTVQQFLIFLRSCVVVAADRNFVDPSSLSKAMKNETDVTKFWKEVIAQRLDRSIDYENALTCLSDASDGVLFVFDEARELLPPVEDAVTGASTTRFHLLRTALHQLVSGQLRHFAIFADTTSCLANFIPKAQYDPSARRVATGINLYPPAFVMPTMGQVKILSRETLPATIAVTWTSNTVSYSEDLNDLVGRSRPMFVVQWENICQQPHLSSVAKWNLLRDLAVTKLMATTSAKPPLALLDAAVAKPNSAWIVEPVDLGADPGVAGVRHPACKAADELAVAVLSCRIDFIPPVVDKDALVASHMATLLGVSADRNQQLIQYVGEPVLAEAACWCWQHDEGKFLMRLISRFHRCIKTGFLGSIQNPGDIGATVAMIFLCRVFDTCSKDSPVTGLFSAPEPQYSFPSSASANLSLSSSSSPSLSSLRPPSSSASSSSSSPNQFPVCIAPVPAIQFLEKLCCASGSMQFCGHTDPVPLGCLTGTCWQRGFMSLAQFVSARVHITTAMLVEAAKGHVAFKCPKSEHDVDFIIPVVFGSLQANNASVSGCLQDASDANIGAMIIQVKNYHKSILSPGPVNEHCHKICDYAAGFGENIPFIGVIMAMGSQRIYKQDGELRQLLLLQPKPVKLSAQQERQVSKLTTAEKLRPVLEALLQPEVHDEEEGEEEDEEEEEEEEEDAEEEDNEGEREEVADGANANQCNFVFGFDSFYEKGKASPLFDNETLVELLDIAALDSRMDVSFCHEAQHPELIEHVTNVCQPYTSDRSEKVEMAEMHRMQNAERRVAAVKAARAR
jgi:hypothetical protein